jgi:hypothetical protein
MGEISSMMVPFFFTVLDRCPGGESVDEMTSRIDGVISKVERRKA